MLYNTGKRLISRIRQSGFIRKIIITILLLGSATLCTSCTLLADRLDNHIGFSKNLSRMEADIRNEDWDKAKISLLNSQTAWKKLKPLMQVDIDHDYIKDIEEGFVKLDAYLDTKDKSNSLAAILVIQSTWKNIGSL